MTQTWKHVHIMKNTTPKKATSLCQDKHVVVPLGQSIILTLCNEGNARVICLPDKDNLHKSSGTHK